MESKLEIEVELILSFFSIALLLIILILFSLFPAIFLKHPNQIYYHSIIYQIFSLLFSILFKFYYLE